jgi:hypothetical protein
LVLFKWLATTNFFIRFKVEGFKKNKRLSNMNFNGIIEQRIAFVTHLNMKIIEHDLQLSLIGFEFGLKKMLHLWESQQRKPSLENNLIK